MTRRRLHWFWRAAMATVVACVFSGLTLDLASIAYSAVEPLLSRWFPFFDVEVVVVPLFLSLPAILVAFITYGLITRVTGGRVDEDRETRCRNCGYILRGISEPTCSECGERI